MSGARVPDNENMATITMQTVAPITRDQIELVTQARSRRRKLDRAAKVAAFGGWTSGVFAMLTLPFVWSSWETCMVAAGLAIVAYHEFKGRRLLLAMDDRGPRLLGFNQIGFACMIVVYCAWQIVKVSRGEGVYAEAIASEPMLADMLGPMGHVMQTLVMGMYVAMIGATVLFQGGTAWYYFSRGRLVRAYREKTPAWVNALV